ncbi:hypothetical protein CN567_22170 [Bacillus toyonensis]|uniref:Uncharacterized protein n=1 Tax=Bacillus toyonensis TaxID=155322 RepID=A0AB36T7Y2_9BACI|nr:hypothetical protein [Bacillus toyonensis]PEC09874.1 hypothetical protein CON55_16000 [Bacillus toyonensis]PEN90170.1 hypothetical protein CN551_07500 [Bacillus toyonensis]PEO60910.1 hypothetical protein CN567_22170 [Bacillus toyonensis]PFX69999.1 hypothetical protein COL37_30250 [Bacillus toyonensis]PFX78936.1 hypothetical protein COL38_21205 [Bacillus toyonensis]
MSNIQRLKMEIAGIELPNEELLIYLEESNLNGDMEYNSASKIHKRAIYETVVTPMDIKAFGETTKDSDGVVTYTWGKDINAENYSGFVGYTLYLYQNGTYSHLINFNKDTTSYKWINRSKGNYSGQIVVRFVDG